MPETASPRRLPTAVLALVVPFVALIAVIVTLSATSSPSAAGSGDAGGGDATGVTIQNFQFAPATLHVTVGAPVKVRNDDGTNHTVTAADGTFDTGTVEGGANATITIDRPGTYKYFCDIHNYMTGTIEAR